MANWNWGQIIFQAVMTGIVVAVIQEVFRRIRRGKGKKEDDEP